MSKTFLVFIIYRKKVEYQIIIFANNKGYNVFCINKNKHNISMLLLKGIKYTFMIHSK